MLSSSSVMGPLLDKTWLAQFLRHVITSLCQQTQAFAKAAAPNRMRVCIFKVKCRTYNVTKGVFYSDESRVFGRAMDCEALCF